MIIVFTWEYEGAPKDIEGQIIPGHTPVDIRSPGSYGGPYKWWTTTDAEPGQWLRIRVHDPSTKWSQWSEAVQLPEPRTVPEPDFLLIGALFVLALLCFRIRRRGI